jgi:cob(I)alamin adenosyltransferase
MKIYTKTGDQGQTGLRGGSRVSKTDPRIQAIGDVDELNATIGLVRCEEDSELLADIQCCLFDLGAELSLPPGKESSGIPEEQTEGLEASIDAMTEAMPALASFILPGGCEGAARLHAARSACRRAERSILALFEESGGVSIESRAYINRLSDWLFVAARYANFKRGVPDVPWKQTR